MLEALRERSASRPFGGALVLAVRARHRPGQLSSIDRQAYAELFKALSPEGRARLDGQKAAGTLSAKDSDGISVLQHLTRLSRGPVPPGAPYSGGEVVEELLRHLERPDMIRQGRRNTCGPTTVQYVLLSERPAEYVRIAACLLADGSVRLQRGRRPLRRVFDSLEEDHSGRDHVERVFQAAFQDYGFELRGSYSNAGDDFRYRVSGRGPSVALRRALASGANRIIVKAQAGQGVAEGKVKQMYEDALGRDARAVGSLFKGLLLAPMSMRKGVWAAVSRAVEQGQPVPVNIIIGKGDQRLLDRPGAQVERILDQRKVSYVDKMSSHQVLVTAIRDGRVHYRNPWGYQTSLSEAEFRSRLTDGFIPRR